MFVNCSERSWSSPQCWESLRKGWEWLQNVRVCSVCVCLEMAVLGAPDRLQGGIYLKFMWISWKQLSIPFQIYRATHLFLLSLESAELHGVVWGCFSRLLREVATNLMIHIFCPSLGRARKAFLLCWAWVFWLSRGWYRQSSRDRDFCTVSVEVARFLSQTPAFVGILIWLACCNQAGIESLLLWKEPMDIYGRHLWGL